VRLPVNLIHNIWTWEFYCVTLLCDLRTPITPWWPNVRTLNLDVKLPCVTHYQKLTNCVQTGKKYFCWAKTILLKHTLYHESSHYEFTSFSNKIKNTQNTQSCKITHHNIARFLNFLLQLPRFWLALSFLKITPRKMACFFDSQLFYRCSKTKHSKTQCNTLWWVHLLHRYHTTTNKDNEYKPILKVRKERFSFFFLQPNNHICAKIDVSLITRN